MFTGLIEEIGSVLGIRATNRGTQLQLSAPRIAGSVHTGDSISVNGCCLTVASHQQEQIMFDLLEETVARTNLGALRRDSTVNLERALAANARLGGHFVQGHIDCTASIIAFAESDSRLEIALPEDRALYVAEKGSIAVDGISLTIAEVKPTSFVTWIIPHTRRYTNLKNAQSGDLVNLEFDILAKYVERMLAPAGGGMSLRSRSAENSGNSAQ
jgi:riboflavin synthase